MILSLRREDNYILLFLLSTTVGILGFVGGSTLSPLVPTKKK